jgi:hypothetical protein
MAWESGDGSIDAMLESGVIVAMGEDVMIRVRNTTASPITKGTALAYNGTSGASGRIKVKPWVGANISTAKLFLGFAACDMPANSNGYSQWFGKLAQINTSGGAQTWLDEQIIYAAPGASATLTNIAPTSGEYAAAAVVINAGSGTSGVLFVRPTLEVASSTSATANTLVLRDGSGATSFAGLTNTGALNLATGTTFTYGTGIAASHLFALGATPTGLGVFTAVDPGAARIVLGGVANGLTGAELFGAADAAAANTILANNIVTKSADFTLVQTDAGTYMRLTKTGSTQQITLPVSGISAGAEFQFYRITTEALAFSGGTVNGTANLASVPTNGAFALKHISSGTYDFI